MKKVKLTALLLAIILTLSCVFPTVSVFAAEVDAEQEETYTTAPYMFRTECIDENKNTVKVWLELSPAVAEAVSAYQISLKLENKEGSAVIGRQMDIAFDSALSGAKVKEAKFDADTQTMKVYVAGTENLVKSTMDADGNITNILPIGNVTAEKLSDKSQNAFKVVLSGPTGDLVTVSPDATRKCAAEVYGAEDKDYYIPVDGTIYSMPVQYSFTLNVEGKGEVKLYKNESGSTILMNEYTADEDTLIKVDAKAADGYELSAIIVDGKAVTDAASFILTKDSEVKVVFAKKNAEPPVDPPTDPDDHDDNCSCICHKTGFMGFIYKIMRFFWKLTGKNKVCVCGQNVHY